MNFSSSTKQSWTHSPQNKSPVLKEDKSLCATSISFIFPPCRYISFTSLKTHPKFKADREPSLRGTWERRPSPRCPGFPAGLRARSRLQERSRLPSSGSRSDRFPLERGLSRARGPFPEEVREAAGLPAFLCFLTSSDLCSPKKESEGDEHGYSRVPGPPSRFPPCEPSLHLHAGHPQVWIKRGHLQFIPAPSFPLYSQRWLLL